MNVCRKVVLQAFLFFLRQSLGRFGCSRLNFGQKASVTQQHLLLLISFSQHAEGQADSPEGGLLCAPLSIPSLSAQVCPSKASGLQTPPEAKSAAPMIYSSLSTISIFCDRIKKTLRGNSGKNRFFRVQKVSRCPADGTVDVS